MTFTLNEGFWKPGNSGPNRSIDFTSASSQKFTMSKANFGVLNTKKWTYHVWFKRRSIGGVTKYLFTTTSPNLMEIKITGANVLDIIVRNGAGSAIGRLVTNAAYTDTANFHQLVIYWDSANATSADRLRLYVDQTRVTSFSTETQPSLNADMWNNTTTYCIGSDNSSGFYYDGQLYSYAFIDNQSPDISTLHDSGSPIDLRGATGLFSLLHTTDSSTLEDDEVLATNWTNTNTVIKSTDIPA